LGYDLDVTNHGNTDENELLLGIIYYDHGIVCNVTAGTFYPVAKRPYSKMTYSPEVDTTKRMSFNNLCRVGRLQSRQSLIVNRIMLCNQPCSPTFSAPLRQFMLHHRVYLLTT